MKIIQFVPSLNNGGGEALVRDYALALNQRGHDIKILVVRKAPNSSNEIMLKENKIKVDSVETFLDNSKILTGRFLAKAVRCFRLVMYIRKECPDVVHVHLTILHLMYLCRSFIPRNVKIVYTCHSMPKIYFGKYKKELRAVKYFLKRGNFKLIGLYEDAVVQMKDIFQSTDITYLYNMINLERFRSPLVSRKAMRTQLGIEQDAFVIGNIGRFADVKNHDFLVEIFAAVAREKSNAFLLMVGDGSLKLQIESKLKGMGLGDRYLILSNRSDIPELDQVMDVCVFPSKYEGFSIAVLEAQACGVKCVCSSSIPSVVFINENIYVLSLEDSVGKWKDAILYNDMPRNISTGRLEDYDMPTIIKKLEKIYRE